MRLIITRVPALDAALIRFDSWWSGLSRREQVLVSALAVLLGGAVLIYGIVKPIQSARAAAISDIRTYETLNARIRAAGRLGSPGPARRQGAPAQVATASANAFGLTIAPQAMARGVRVELADVSFDTMMAWLADLSGTSDLRVRRLSVQRRPSPGRVSASVELAQ